MATAGEQRVIKATFSVQAQFPSGLFEFPTIGRIISGAAQLSPQNNNAVATAYHRVRSDLESINKLDLSN